MAIKRTLDAYDLQDEFRRHNRDHFSIEAYQKLIDLSDELGEDWELDVIALCCDFNEMHWEDIRNEYSNHDDLAECETFEEFYEALSDYTLSIETEDGMILYQVW